MGPSIRELTEKQINTDIWEQMKGDLPCAEASTTCINQLQALAGQNNPLLKEFDAKIAEVQGRIDEAKSLNKSSIQLSVFEPALQVLLRTETVTDPQTRQTRSVGFFERLGQIFTNPVPLFNTLFNAIGVPLLRGASGGNEAQRAAQISISDLQIKLAQMQRDRAQLADVLREKVYQASFELDDAKREFQISQELARGRRKLNQLQEIEYRLGGGSTESYLQHSFQLQQSDAAVFRSWTKFRSNLTKIKLLCLGAEGL